MKTLFLIICMLAVIVPAKTAFEKTTRAAIADSQHGGPMLTILCYHHVGSVIRSDYNITTAQLNSQMDALLKAGFVFVNSAQVEAFYTKGTPIPMKSAFVTFDDGDYDVYENAYPLLKKRGIPFAFYVYTNTVNLGHAKHSVSWDDLRDMAEHGVTIGCHSRSHPILTHPPDTVKTPDDYKVWLKKEIVDSKAEIEQKLGRPVTEFAVPYGAYDRFVYTAIKAAGYTLVMNVHGMNDDAASDPCNLNRLIILGSASMDRFLEITTAPPLQFNLTVPNDLARVETENTDLHFQLKNESFFDMSTLQARVASFRGLELHHIEEGDQFEEKLDLRKPTFYAMRVTVKDLSGRLCRGAWLFIYDKKNPSFLP